MVVFFQYKNYDNNQTQENRSTTPSDPKDILLKEEKEIFHQIFAETDLLVYFLHLDL